MARAELGEQDWDIRLSVYQGFVAGGGPPTYAQVARQFDIPAEEARQAYQRLHRGHALFLESATEPNPHGQPPLGDPDLVPGPRRGRLPLGQLRMGILGIPAMLRADAHIETAFAHSREPTTYAVAAGVLTAEWRAWCISRCLSVYGTTT